MIHKGQELASFRAPWLAAASAFLAITRATSAAAIFVNVPASIGGRERK